MSYDGRKPEPPYPVDSDYEQRIAELEADLAKHQESEFHPDWSLLEAARESLREHMARIKALEAERDAAYNRGMERALTIVSESSNVFEAHESIRKEIKT